MLHGECLFKINKKILDRAKLLIQQSFENNYLEGSLCLEILLVKSLKEQNITTYPLANQYKSWDIFDFLPLMK